MSAVRPPGARPSETQRCLRFNSAISALPDDQSHAAGEPPIGGGTKRMSRHTNIDVLQSSVRSVRPRTFLRASVIGRAGQLLGEAGRPRTTGA